MGLVDYESSEEEGEIREPDAKRRCIEEVESKAPELTEEESTALPPLPEKFRDLYAVKPRASTYDDPSLHQGRKRNTPHVKGNWPTHAYLDWLPSPEALSLLSDILKHVDRHTKSKIHTSLVSEFGSPLPLHISLSTQILLHTDERDDYFNALTETVNDFLGLNEEAERREAHKEPLEVRLNGVRWAANANGSRWFLVADVARPRCDDLNKLLAACNAVATSKGLPTLYMSKPLWEQEQDKQYLTQAYLLEGRTLPKPLTTVSDVFRDYSNRFHFSFAWTLDAPIPESAFTEDVNIPHEYHLDLTATKIKLKAVKVKIGNVIKSIPLDRA